MSISKRQGEESNARRRKQRGSQQAADWSTIEPSAVLKAVHALATAGGALRLGYTRDGGAFAIGIYGDGEPYTEYLRPSDDITGYFEGLCEDYGEPDARPASKAP